MCSVYRGEGRDRSSIAAILVALNAADITQAENVEPNLTIRYKFYSALLEARVLQGPLVSSLISLFTVHYPVDLAGPASPYSATLLWRSSATDLRLSGSKPI